MLAFIASIPFWLRLLMFCAACCVHFLFCRQIDLEEIAAKQPKKGDNSGEYAQELEQKHRSLGQLNNLGYTDFWVVKLEDLKIISPKEYIISLGIVLLLFWSLFI